MTNRVDKFMDIFRLGLQASQNKQLKKNLGDRSAYLGLSDLAKYQECPRAAIAAKLGINRDDNSRLMAFGRGHWFEQGVSDSFTALGLNHLRQLEISCQYQGAPIKGHLDIALVWAKPYPAVRILEIKSMEKLPVEPYSSHKWQAAAQTALLKRHWNEPVFCADKLEALTFPELCRQRFDLRLPDSVENCSIEGWLLCVSMTDSAAFGPFNSDHDFLENLNIQAGTMWRQLELLKSGELDLKNVPCAIGHYPLCAWCDVNRDCPKFTVEALHRELEPVLTRLDKLKASRDKLDSEIREIESGIKLAHQNSGVNDWINTGLHRFKVISAKGRRMLDRSLLEMELGDLFHSLELVGETVEAFLGRCERESTPSTRLSIQCLAQER